MRYSRAKIGERYFASGGPGAVIDIAPGSWAQVQHEGSYWRCGGFLRYSGLPGSNLGTFPVFNSQRPGRQTLSWALGHDCAGRRCRKCSTDHQTSGRNPGTTEAS